jgi:tetratricopeptide (TPR) repeat protein
MDQLLDSSSTRSAQLRVAVIGNSNSAMVVSFARTLAKAPNVTVANKSIGGSPSVVLLDFLVREGDQDYDFIIVETAVCDFLQRGSYTCERSKETLELFIGSVRSISNAQIILLTIPTRYALLEPGIHWQEPLYQEVAEQFGIPILDGFRLVRQLVGLPKMEQVHIFLRRMKKLMSSFGLPEKLFHSLAWHSLRDQGFPPNALGIYGFVDHAHFSAAMHSLVGSLLHQFICSNAGPLRDGLVNRPDAASATVVESEPVGSRYVNRQSSLISRKLLVLSSGETTLYRCPPGYRAFGLLLNASATSGGLSVRSPAGNTTLDFPFGPQPHEWVAIIVPISDPIGDGDIEMTVIPGTQPGVSTGKAEVGELILVRTDWRELVPAVRGEATGALHIEDAAWAKPIIADAGAEANTLALGIDADNRMINNECFSFAANLLGTATTSLSHADRARLMVVMGQMEQLPAFLDAACAEQDGDVELGQMRAALREVKADDDVTPNQVLSRAVGLAQSGAVDASDALLAEGMARSMGRIDLFTESANNASRRKDWPEALRRWSLVQSMFPHNSAGYVGSASTLREMGRLDEAASLLVRVKDMFPDDAYAFVEQAWLENRRGAWDVAAGYWEVVQEKFPSHPAGYVGGAAAYHALGRFVDADNLIVEGRRHFPDNREIAFWWADLAAQRADWHEAAKRWLALRDVFPTELRCILDAARALTEAGEPMRADALIAEARESFPHDSRLIWRWADQADHQRDWPVAAERWKVVRERFPTEKRAYRHEIRAQAEAGGSETAVGLARKAVAVFPDQTDILLQAGSIAARFGELATAAEWYGAACAVDRTDLDAVRRYVETLISLDRTADTTVVLDQALSEWPCNETLIRLRIENALRAKMFGDALSVWDRLLQNCGQDRTLPATVAELIIKASPPEEDLARLQSFLSLGSDGRGTA